MRFKHSIIVLLVLLLLSTGCNTNPPPDGASEFPFDLMVNINDLSNQFELSSNEFPIINGAFSLNETYRNRSNKTGAVFTHQITIYPDSKSANAAYSSWKTEWFNEHWITPKDSIFRPKKIEDSYQLRCMDVIIDELPSRSCRLLQVHNNLIILILTNTNSENIDFPSFEDILSRLDARLPEGDIPMPGQ